MTIVRGRARILERTITAGNGPYALAGAVSGSYNSFSSFMSVGDTTYASVVEPGVAFWTGIVTYSDDDEITLTTVEESYGTFGAGTKEIMCGPLASTGMFREDISGAIVTGGTSTAYTVASYREYDTLARLNGNIIAFTPHATNTGPCTLSVDGLSAKALRANSTADLFPGTLIQGTPYMAFYNAGDATFYLHGFYGNPYNVPLASGMDYWASTTPNSAFAFPLGQDLSRTTYASLYALIGTTYGSSSGSTFKLPNKAGRVSAMKEASAALLTTAGSGVDGATIGAKGGGQNVTLATSHIPTHSSSGTPMITVTGPVGHTLFSDGNPPGSSTTGGGVFNFNTLAATNPGTFQGDFTFTGSNSITVTYSNGSQVPVNAVQPTIVCNYIMRVL